jgi:hypothetical protein
MMRRRFSLAFLLVVVVIFMSCDRKIFTSEVDCSECYQTKPDKYFLMVYLTFNDSITEIPVVLYNGDVEKGDVLGYDTVRAEDERPYMYFEDVTVDRDYSMRAEYRFAERTLYTIDGIHPKAKLVTDVCDQSCYVIEDNEMNLEVKDEFLKQGK